MHDDSYEKLNKNQITSLLEEINPLLDFSDFSAERTVILARQLPFYHGFMLLDITDHSIRPEKKALVIYNDDEIYPVTWDSGLIYQLNDKIPLFLNDEIAEDYIRFFFETVNGPRGKLIIVDNVDDIMWRDEPPPSARRALGKTIRPLSYIGQDENGYYIFEMTTFFNQTLYKCKVTCDGTGRVLISDEEVLIEDLPVIDRISGS